MTETAKQGYTTEREKRKGGTLDQTQSKDVIGGKDWI